VRAIRDICGLGFEKTLLRKLELSGDKEGWVNGSEPAVDINSMTIGNEVVRGLLDSAPDSCSLAAHGDKEGGKVERLPSGGGEYVNGTGATSLKRARRG